MDDHLLEKFFKGQCNEQEKQQILHWYLSGRAEKALSDRIKAIWKEEHDAEKNWEKESILTAINKKIDETEEVQPKALYSSRGLWKWRYAAAIFFLILGGWWYTQYVGTTDMNVTSATHIIYKQTERGEKRTVALQDGTIVKLNADSRIWYRDTFGKEAIREVFLEGEAFFEVARDAQHPFLVHTGGVETTVLGTSFNINAYNPDEFVTVSVVSGKVQVREGQQNRPPLFLQPDEQAVYTVKDSTLFKSRFDYQQVLSWKEGTLYFKNASFDEIIKTLDRWYGVDIEVRRSDIEDGFSGTYTDCSLEKVLNGVGFVLHFDYEIHDDKVIIK